MKRNYLFGILIVLLLLAYVVLQKEGEQNVSSDGEKFVKLDSLAVDRMTVRSSTSPSITVERQGGEWYLTEPIHYKADNSAMAEVVHRMKDLEIKNVVSSNPEKQSLFKVDSTGTRVTMYENGNEKITFYVGKTGPNYSDTYLRKENDLEVVLVNAELTQSFTKPLKDWREKSILTVPRENIKEVRYQYGDTLFALTQKGANWLIGSDSTQENVVSSLLSSLSDVKADDFLDTVNAATKKVQIQITYAGSQLRFAYDKKAAKYYVQSSRSSQWYVIEQWKAEQLLKRKKDLKKK